MELADELTESRRESAELKAQPHRVTEQQQTETVALPLEVKMLKRRCAEAEEELEILKRRCAEAEEELEMMRKKAETATASEDEILGLKRAAEVAKAVEEKAVKEKEEALNEVHKLKREKDILLDCATTRYKAVEKRFEALEAHLANLTNLSGSSSGPTAAGGVQETMDSAIVDLDST